MEKILKKKMEGETNSTRSYPDKYIRDNNIKDIINSYSRYSKSELIAKNKKVKVAGRLFNVNNLGGIIFFKIADETGRLQLIAYKNKNFVKLNVGDIVGVAGTVCKSDTGELSIKAEEIILISKCLISFPDIHNGFTNLEERFRRRYLDFLINDRSKEVMVIRYEVIRSIRDFLDKQKYLEFETPMLVYSASGAQARPFVTYHNKLQRDFYLRIATEIPLKQLLIGGFVRVFEIGRIFRNEGIDSQHNPEFTSIEIYNAYENADYMINLTEDLFHHLSNFIKKNNFNFNSCTVDLSKPFQRISMTEAVKKYTGVDFNLIDSLDEALKEADKHMVKLEPFQNTIGFILLAFFEAHVEKKIVQPTFIYDYPIETSPLAKTKVDNSKLADRFELYIAGLEFANGYSELNDPLEQQKRFEEQRKQKTLGNEEVAEFDKEFIEALKCGMPPAAGCGIGIDRLIMLLSEQNSIKEVIAFPALKSKNLLKIEDEKSE